MYHQTATTVPPCPDDTGTQIRRRRIASYRLTPLDDGRQDPLESTFRPPQPSSYGLTVEELRAEIRRCQNAGWQPWELRARFTDPRLLQASLDRARTDEQILYPELENAA